MIDIHQQTLDLLQESAAVLHRYCSSFAVVLSQLYCILQYPSIVYIVYP